MVDEILKEALEPAESESLPDIDGKNRNSLDLNIYVCIFN